MAKAQIGDSVRVLTTTLTAMGMPTRKIQGGEGRLIDIFEDTKGTVYTVRLNRNGKTRDVRKGQLRVHLHQPHRKKNKKPA